MVCFMSETVTTWELHTVGGITRDLLMRMRYVQT